MLRNERVVSELKAVLPRVDEALKARALRQAHMASELQAYAGSRAQALAAQPSDPAAAFNAAYFGQLQQLTADFMFALNAKWQSKGREEEAGHDF